MPDVRPPERAIGFWVAALREAFAPFASARGVFMDGAAFVVVARA